MHFFYIFAKNVLVYVSSPPFSLQVKNYTPNADAALQMHFNLCYRCLQRIRDWLERLKIGFDSSKKETVYYKE